MKKRLIEQIIREKYREYASHIIRQILGDDNCLNEGASRFENVWEAIKSQVQEEESISLELYEDTIRMFCRKLISTLSRSELKLLWLNTEHYFNYNDSKGMPDNNELEDVIEDELLAEVCILSKDGGVGILPDLLKKYSKWLQPEIISVAIVHKEGSVYLEILRDNNSKSGINETIDLSFIVGDDDEEELFPYDKGVLLNARNYMKYMVPYSIINCTSLFTDEACVVIDDIYQKTQQITDLTKEKVIRYLIKNFPEK